jgi:hypothetical protein
MKVHNLPKVVMKNDFTRPGVEPGSLDLKANTILTEPELERVYLRSDRVFGTFQIRKKN